MATHAPSSTRLDAPYTAPLYVERREALATYFDSTAKQAWIDLTSDAKVSGIRATVRAGREQMRRTLVSWLPTDLRRMRVLDAGCGTGALATEAACLGADVTAVDVAGGLVEVAKSRATGFIGHGKVRWRAGDMLDPEHGEFAHVVAMDSLIHYSPDDLVAALRELSERTSGSILFTFAPHTRLLGAMHSVGKVFPKSDRSPAIVPVAEDDLRERLTSLDGWSIGRTHRVSSGFYKSQAMELVKHA